jgi:hypothetical protein
MLQQQTTVMNKTTVYYTSKKNTWDNIYMHAIIYVILEPNQRSTTPKHHKNTWATWQCHDLNPTNNNSSYQIDLGNLNKCQF